jgi:MazG family protein
MARLRAPGGCPWDREQTNASIKPYTIEEAYEVAEAIDHDDDRELCGELGDLLLQIVFHAQMASETGRFTVVDVCRAISEKMVRRHPHVFADTKVEGTADVLRNWSRIKAEERKGSADRRRSPGCRAHAGRCAGNAWEKGHPRWFRLARHRRRARQSARSSASSRRR